LTASTEFSFGWADLREFDKTRGLLASADSIERVRVIEASAAAMYFPAWRDVQIRSASATSRESQRAGFAAIPRLGADRRASRGNVADHSMRNYLFACLESEARLALLAHGCDPRWAFLHADQRNRDSLALDAIEGVRSDVDSFLPRPFRNREFTARDFGELPNGICRIAAPLTHELALTLPHWRECLRPIAASLAQTFRESLVNKGAPPRSLAAKSGNKAPQHPGSGAIAAARNPSQASQPRPYATRAWRAPSVEARPANPTACAMCGEPILKRRRRHCDACMPKARREHGLRAIEAARKVLAAQTAAGNDPRRSPDVNRVRGEAISDGHRRNRSWAREHPEQRDEAWFKREITPKLDAFSLKEIGKATGLSLAACSRIELAQRFRIRDTGRACSRWSRLGTEHQRRTS